MPDIILKIAKKERMKMKVFAVVILGMGLLGFTLKEQHNPNPKNLKGQEIEQVESGDATLTDSESMPVYGNWRNFTTSDGLPGDKAYCVRIDGERVLVGTHEGLAVYEQNKWTTYTSEDGLAHNGVLAIDINEFTGDVWLGTMGGLSRWSGGRFENFTQMNSGMPNDLIYSVICDGNDVWVATGGGAGKFDSFSKRWEIYTEQNAPMHEPWTYGVCAGYDKVFIAAWGGGVIEYNKKILEYQKK